MQNNGQTQEDITVPNPNQEVLEQQNPDQADLVAAAPDAVEPFAFDPNQAVSTPDVSDVPPTPDAPKSHFGGLRRFVAGAALTGVAAAVVGGGLAAEKALNGSTEVAGTAVPAAAGMPNSLPSIAASLPKETNGNIAITVPAPETSAVAPAVTVPEAVAPEDPTVAEAPSTVAQSVESPATTPAVVAPVIEAPVTSSAAAEAPASSAEKIDPITEALQEPILNYVHGLPQSEITVTPDEENPENVSVSHTTAPLQPKFGTEQRNSGTEARLTVTVHGKVDSAGNLISADSAYFELSTHNSGRVDTPYVFAFSDPSDKNPALDPAPTVDVKAEVKDQTGTLVDENSTNDNPGANAIVVTAGNVKLVTDQLKVVLDNTTNGVADYAPAFGG